MNLLIITVRKSKLLIFKNKLGPAIYEKLVHVKIIKSYYPLLIDSLNKYTVLLIEFSALGIASACKWWIPCNSRYCIKEESTKHFSYFDYLWYDYRILPCVNEDIIVVSLVCFLCFILICYILLCNILYLILNCCVRSRFVLSFIVWKIIIIEFACLRYIYIKYLAPRNVYWIFR